MFPKYFEEIHLFLSKLIKEDSNKRLSILFEKCDYLINLLTKDDDDEEDKNVNDQLKEEKIKEKIEEEKKLKILNISKIKEENEKEIILPKKYESIEIISSIICSSIRTSTSTTEIIKGLKMISKLSTYSTDFNIFKRLIPYCCSIFNKETKEDKSNSIIKVIAIQTLTNILEKINSIDIQDYEIEINLYSDYIRPLLDNLMNDQSDIVRSCFSEYLPIICYESKRFLGKPFHI
jgi:hypothetical protein